MKLLILTQRKSKWVVCNLYLRLNTKVCITILHMQVMSNTEDYLKGVTFVDIFGQRSDNPRSDNPNTDRKFVTYNTEDYLAGITLDDIIGDESDYIEADRKQVAVFVLVYSGLLTLKQVTSNTEDYLEGITCTIITHYGQIKLCKYKLTKYC